MNIKNDISNSEDDDLKEMAPLLSKSGRKSPFKANENYFDNFSSKLDSRITDFEEIKTDASALSNIPIYNPFEVPPAYFDELPTRIQEVVLNKATTTTFLEWLILFIKPNFAIPVLATVCIAFAGIHFIEKQGERTATQTEYQLSEEEQLYLIDEATILDAIASVSNIDNENTTESSDAENYLIDNNFDESNLNNEL